MTDHVAGSQQPASSPTEAPRWAPPLDVALTGARETLADLARLWPNIGTASAPLLAEHIGALDVSLRMLADAVTVEVYGRDAS
ncbi:hypothetical protein OHB04_22735 [Streptomyces sp. NBC_01775]|uniref:hypothetical protein n=1 Tax=Streptomyces sp. NBC_01775 TaxID=2975939 RepID=UPI002DD8DCC1|nr:hypothetical protein [Streptomyces sp. NBC_01775]WSB78311.1 hypothetical protein OHB04_22735 [Streptomyces sp. NBC_01775]